MLAPHTPEKKSLREKKVGSAEEKHACCFFSKSRIYRRGDKPRLPFFSKSRIYRIYQIAASAKPAISEGGFAAWLTPFAGDEVNPRMAD